MSEIEPSKPAETKYPAIYFKKTTEDLWIMMEDGNEINITKISELHKDAIRLAEFCKNKQYIEGAAFVQDQEELNTWGQSFLEKWQESK